MSNNFGERLKMSLKQSGYTQKAATEELELSKNAITNYVGGRIPDALILYKLAKLCSVSMEWLLTGENSEYTIEETSSIETEVLDKLRGLPEDDQPKVIGYIDAMLVNSDNHLKREVSSESTNGEEAATNETA